MQKRQKKQLVGLVVFAIVLLVGPKINGLIEEPAQRAVAPAGFYAVTDFNDGDTITVDMSGRQEKIRFIGVDTPETQDPRKAVQCFGKAASQFTKDLIGEQAVRLEADPLNTNRDRYNRLLRYIYLPDGRLVNAEIIAQGYGFAYTSFPFTKADEFRALQTTARTEEKGLWKSCTPEQNKYGSYTSNAE